MFKNSHRVARLLSLVREIKLHPNQTPKQLCESLGICKAQLYRDRQELESLGFCFRYDRSDRTFVLEKDCYIPMEQLGLEELLAIVLAVHQLSVSGEGFLAGRARAGAAKLVAGLSGQLRQACVSLLEATPSPHCTKGPVPLTRLRQALAESRRVKITYVKPSGTEETYEIEPYLLFLRNGFLYLDAFSVKRKKIRTFRVSRITSVTPTAIRFGSIRGYNFAERYQQAFGVFTDSDPEQVVLRFARRIRPYIEEAQYHPSQRIQSQSDGSILFSVEVAEPREVLWWAMRWGDGFEVIEPVWLREETLEMVERMRQLYG